MVRSMIVVTGKLLPSRDQLATGIGRDQHGQIGAGDDVGSAHDDRRLGYVWQVATDVGPCGAGVRRLEQVADARAGASATCRRSRRRAVASVATCQTYPDDDHRARIQHDRRLRLWPCWSRAIPGTSWSRLGNNFPTTTIMDLTIGPDGLLYGLSARGAGRLVDPWHLNAIAKGALWQAEGIKREGRRCPDRSSKLVASLANRVQHSGLPNMSIELGAKRIQLMRNILGL